MNENIYSQELLDAVDDAITIRQSWIEKMIEAKKEAYKQRIRANAVLINRGSNAFAGLAKVEEQFFAQNNELVTVPEMILGLDVYITDELPEEYGFAILEARHTKADIEYEKVKSKVIDELRDMPLSELANLLYKEDD